jgi:hypothetical protein
MEHIIHRKHSVNAEIDDLKKRIHNLKSIKPTDLVVIRALALKVTDLNNELAVIDVIMNS